MPPPRLFAFVMAGSKGYGFGPLTRERSKSDLPFAARYRIIDFPLSNLRNSGVTAICVLTQHGSNSLSDHINDTWRVRPGPFQSITARTAKYQSGNRLYRGTADAVLQNFDLVDDFQPDAVLVLPGEHVSRINLRCMAEFHKLCGASATIACLPMPITDAVRFGIVEIDAEQRIVGFREKPGGDIRCLPTRPGHVMASTGIYVFSPEPLREALALGVRYASHFDFAANILPTIAQAGGLFCYDLEGNRLSTSDRTNALACWWDIPNIDAYFDLNMSLLDEMPILDVYDPGWPIGCSDSLSPPSRLLDDPVAGPASAVRSIIAEGCVVQGAVIRNSVIGRDVLIEAGAQIQESILFDKVRVGRDVVVRRSIIDAGVSVAAGEDLNRQCDPSRYSIHTSPGGITVVSAGLGSISDMLHLL